MRTIVRHILLFTTHVRAKCLSGRARPTSKLLRSAQCNDFLFAVVLFAVGPSFAQEVPFTPRFDGISRGTQQAKSTTVVPLDTAEEARVYSSQRFNELLNEVCSLLEADGRRLRFVMLAEQAAAKEDSCPTCKGFFRHVAERCGAASGAIATTGKKPAPPAQRPVSVAQGHSSAETELAQTAAPVTRKRFPRTDLLEVLSRLSEQLYEFKPRPGSIVNALSRFQEWQLADASLSPDERDYFSIVAAYLCAAWAGRKGPPAENALPQKDGT